MKLKLLDIKMKKDAELIHHIRCLRQELRTLNGFQLFFMKEIYKENVREAERRDLII